jgi:hypothetical protein
VISLTTEAYLPQLAPLLLKWDDEPSYSGFYYNRRGVDDKTAGTATFGGNVTGAGLLIINGWRNASFRDRIKSYFQWSRLDCRNAECRLSVL